MIIFFSRLKKKAEVSFHKVKFVLKKAEYDCFWKATSIREYDKIIATDRILVTRLYACDQIVCLWLFFSSSIKNKIHSADTPVYVL